MYMAPEVYKELPYSEKVGVRCMLIQFDDRVCALPVEIARHTQLCACAGSSRNAALPIDSNDQWLA
jgi:hypothetical protein